MLRNSDGETEILLGNKQLLGLFVVVVCLLGIAFTGGYKIGQASRRSAPATAAAAAAAPDETAGGTAAGNGPAGGGVTQQLPGDSGSAAAGSTAAPETGAASESVPPPPAHTPSDEDARNAAASEKQSAAAAERQATAAHAKTRHETSRVDGEAIGPARTPEPAAIRESANFTPQNGQMFLQVAAVSRDEAEGIAEVLRKKGFHAHAVPKPGSIKLYRVIIGPVRDAGDLNSTRSQLRNNAGFRDIIVQRY